MAGIRSSKDGMDASTLGGEARSRGRTCCRAESLIVFSIISIEFNL